MLAKWWNKKNNWGDELNPVLIRKISGITPRNVFNAENIPKDEPIYLVIGSILGWFKDRNLVIWGAGFMYPNEKLLSKPKKICAVRGPLSRKIILRQGIDCPKIYGDPSLLYPRFYKPNKKKKYRLGVIAHWTEQSFAVEKFGKNPDILIIDITKGVNEVVDDICSCESIASSSLHGIIAADAYGIPSTWISFRDRGDAFKFKDYFLSVGRKVSIGRKDRKPLLIKERTTLEDIYNKFYDYEIDIDLDKLLEVCPFRRGR